MNYGGHFDPDNKKKRIIELEEIVNNPNFWNSDNSNEILSELSNLKSKLKNIEEIKNNIDSNLELANIIKDNYDDEVSELITGEIEILNEKLNNIELNLLLNGEYDSCDCIIKACATARMLSLYVQRWMEK